MVEKGDKITWTTRNVDLEGEVVDVALSGAAIVKVTSIGIEKGEEVIVSPDRFRKIAAENPIFVTQEMAQLVKDLRSGEADDVERIRVEEGVENAAGVVGWIIGEGVYPPEIESWTTEQFVADFGKANVELTDDEIKGIKEMVETEQGRADLGWEEPLKKEAAILRHERLADMYLDQLGQHNEVSVEDIRAWLEASYGQVMDIPEQDINIIWQKASEKISYSSKEGASKEYDKVKSAGAAAAKKGEKNSRKAFGKYCQNKGVSGASKSLWKAWQEGWGGVRKEGALSFDEAVKLAEESRTCAVCGEKMEGEEGKDYYRSYFAPYEYYHAGCSEEYLKDMPKKGALSFDEAVNEAMCGPHKKRKKKKRKKVLAFDGAVEAAKKKQEPYDKHWKPEERSNTLSGKTAAFTDPSPGELVELMDSDTGERLTRDRGKYVAWTPDDGGKAVVKWPDGSVRLHNVEELRGFGKTAALSFDEAVKLAQEDTEAGWSEEEEKLLDDAKYDDGDEIDLEFGDHIDCGAYGRSMYVINRHSGATSPKLWITDRPPESENEAGWYLSPFKVKAIEKDGIWYEVEWNKEDDYYYVTKVRGYA